MINVLSWGIAIAALAAFGIWIVRGFRGPKAKTTHLAMVVWAAFGPDRSADAAEDTLREAIQAVFGADKSGQYAEWIKGHADNFRMWEAAGSFEANLESMRSVLRASAYGTDFENAFSKFKEQARVRALRSLDELSESLGDETINPFRAFLDGSQTPEQVNEAVEANQKRLAMQIVTGMGERLLYHDSKEAASLARFLQDLNLRETGNEATTTEDVGTLYLKLISYSVDNPGTEIGMTFLTLDDAWKATFLNNSTEGLISEE